MQILSVNVALPSVQQLGGQQVHTSIAKRPVLGAVHAGAAGLQGDGRADRRKFGETHHAVSTLERAHYNHWRARSGRAELPYGSLGENLTTEGLGEHQVRIGDIWRCGSALLQVAQPRIPCRKLRDTLGLATTRELLESGRVGYYLRVLQPGELSAPARIEVEHSEQAAPTVEEFLRIAQFDYWDAEGLAKLLNAPGLVPAWREMLQDKLTRARDATGWLGFRPLRVEQRTPYPGDALGVLAQLSCPWGRTLPTCTVGQRMVLALRTDPRAAPTRRGAIVLRCADDGRSYTIAMAPQRNAARELIAEDEPIAALYSALREGDEIRCSAPHGQPPLGVLGRESSHVDLIADDPGTPLAIALAEHIALRHTALQAQVLLPVAQALPAESERVTWLHPSAHEALIDAAARLPTLRRPSPTQHLFAVGSTSTLEAVATRAHGAGISPDRVHLVRVP